MIKKHIRQIFKGSNQFQVELSIGYPLHVKRVYAIWHNRKYNDFGLERLFRLFLSGLMFLYPGILIETLFNSKSYINRKLAIELYIVFKTLLPLFVLYNGWYVNPFIYYLNIYLLSETYVYLFSKVFLSEHHAKTSNKRTLLLLLINFVESALCFAVIYSSGNYLNLPLKDVVDAIYFSILTSSTVGYGDLHPITRMGKIITALQVLCSISFIVLFFNFFSGSPSIISNEPDIEK